MDNLDGEDFVRILFSTPMCYELLMIKFIKKILTC